MPYAPITHPLESVCMLEGQRCTPAQMAQKKAVLDRQHERLKRKGERYNSTAAQAQRLRATGLQYKDIALQMGITEDAVYRAIKRKI
jgi:DNA-binding NarL/FixJ family response regulator